MPAVKTKIALAGSQIACRLFGRSQPGRTTPSSLDGVSEDRIQPGCRLRVSVWRPDYGLLVLNSASLASWRAPTSFHGAAMNVQAPSGCIEILMKLPT